MTIRHTRFAGPMALCLTLGCAGTGQATEGYFALGYSPGDRAQAGAGVAFAGGAMSATRNPAGIATLGRSLAFGAEVFHPRRGFEATAQGRIDSGRDYFLIPNMAYNHPLSENSALSFTLYGNGGMNTSYAASDNVFGMGAAGVDLTQLFASVGYARRDGALDWGIAPTLAVQRFKAEGLGAFAGMSMDPANLTDRGADWSYGLGLRFGVQYQATPQLRLGLAGQTKFAMTTFDKYAGLFEGGGSFDIPAQLTFGVSYQARPDLTLLADVQRIFYSGIPAISNATNAGPLGADGGAGFGWDDVDVIRLGAIWKQSEAMWWRLGYAHATNPIGPEDVMLNILAPGVVEDHFTFGASRRLNGRDTMDFSVVYVPKSTVSGPQYFNGAPTGGTVKLEMSQVSASVGWRRKF